MALDDKETKFGRTDQDSPSPPHYETLSDLPNDQNGQAPLESPQYVEDGEDIQALPRIYHAPHSSHPPRRGARRGNNTNGNGVPRSSPPSRLGAIDEQSNTVAPDIPAKNPKRKLHGRHHSVNSRHKYFTLAYYLEKQNVPPVDAYDKVVGPRGEKFADLRHNKPFSPPGRGGRRKFICLGSIVAIIVVIALGVGLGVGLTRRKGTSQNASSNSGSSGTTNWPSPFPIGTFTIPTFLSAINTNCTGNSSTWRCYPYTTYSPSSSSSSYSALVWRITSPNNSTLNLDISATQPTFSYPFSSIPLSLTNGNDNTRAAFTFTYTYRKTVIPTTDITGTGAAARCYYNNTVLAVRLYATAQGAGGNIVLPPSAAGGNNATNNNWPYAVEYEETSTQGPECYTYVNGADAVRVNVAAATGTCACDYRNFNLG